LLALPELGQGAQPREVKSRPPVKIHSPPTKLYVDYGLTELIEVSDFQIPPWDDYQTSLSHLTYCISLMLTENHTTTINN